VSLSPTLGEVTLLGLVQGASEVLPISATGHHATLGLWLAGGAPARALTALFHLGAFVAIAFAIRRHLGFVVGEGIRAIARPRLLRSSPGGYDAAFLVLAALASGVTRSLVGPLVRSLVDMPVAVGVGLLATAALLASTELAPRGRASAPSPGGAVLVGFVNGLAVLPGASGTAAALAALLFLGVRASRALDLALLLALPMLAAQSARALFVGEAHALSAVGGLTASAGLLVAIASASVAVALLRGLVEKQRLAWLGLWLVPLGLANIAYGRALAMAAPADLAPIHVAPIPDPSPVPGGMGRGMGAHQETT
jgi:undecaprenyl-diphosphatase